LDDVFLPNLKKLVEAWDRSGIQRHS